MTEAFLHFLWQYSLFEKNNLLTDDDYEVEVITPGQYNTDAGPDFFNSKLKINGILWAGNVEIHIKSSDWRRHSHQNDQSYDSCILHVVFENDEPTFRMNGSRIPTIELKNKFPSYLWENYLGLLGERTWIPCQPRINTLEKSIWENTFEIIIKERLEQKAHQILISLQGNKGNWDECFYQYLARNFGFRINAIPFEMLSRSLPLKFIRKVNDRLIDIEALLFGQAGMLNEEFTDEYPLKLKEIYSHLSNKYSLTNIPYSSWKLLRLRPVNFPAIRLGQFASLLFKCPTLFSSMTDSSSLENISKYFQVQSSDFWNTHYHFNKESTYIIKKLGESSINNILINTCIPFLYAWGKYTGDNEKIEKTFPFLMNLPAEENNIISQWKEAGVFARNALDSQSLIQLKIFHCSEKKCLSCNIGKQIIQNINANTDYSE